MTSIQRALILFCITLTIAAQHTRASQPPGVSCSPSNVSCGTPSFILGSSSDRSDASLHLQYVRDFANRSRAIAERILLQCPRWQDHEEPPTCLSGAQRNHSQDLLLNRTDALADLLFFNNFLSSTESFRRVFGGRPMSLFRSFTANKTNEKLLCQVKLALDSTVHNVTFTYRHACACGNRTIPDGGERNFAIHLVKRMKGVFDSLSTWGSTSS